MKKIINGLNAKAMDNYIRNKSEEIGDDENSLYWDWLSNGVPDGSDIADCINLYGDDKDFKELLDEFFQICEFYQIKKGYNEELDKLYEELGACIDSNIYN